MKIKNILLFFLVGISSGVIGAFTFKQITKSDRIALEDEIVLPPSKSEEGSEVFAKNSAIESGTAPTDFKEAAKISKPTVVFIKVLSNRQRESMDFFWDFFGNMGPVSSSGSGVIVSSDGYIVTNNHVIENANSIEVILNDNKTSFNAMIVGTDPSTDLAVLKIDATNLPKIQFENSDNLAIGEWVLAVGNPFNLTSTVTAGIVSAKGRNINILKNQFPIESFIQTDAAINPGNSGGALVSTEGKLVGINTAIYSKTGSYAGYGFAVPSNIVAKVIKDIKEFGYVQRAFIEAEIIDIDTKIAQKLDGNNEGVYVLSTIKGGNANEAGIKEGDLILKIDNNKINTRAEFDEQIAYKRPGDKIMLTLMRGKKELNIQLALHNSRGTANLKESKSYYSKELSAELETVSPLEMRKYGISEGIKIVAYKGRSKLSNLGLPEGYIILKLNGKTYNDPEEFSSDFNSARSMNIEGINPNGTKSNYQFRYY